MIKKELTICLGITDEVFINGKLIGHVGFHEYDGYIPFWDLDQKSSSLGIIVNTDVYTLKTGYGYHFLSLEIMKKKKWELWKKFAQEIFPSDYLNETKHRVLRISKKRNAMQPTFMFNYIFGRINKEISNGHFQVYKQTGILLNPILVIGKMIDTEVRFCEYKSAKIRGEEK